MMMWMTMPWKIPTENTALSVVKMNTGSFASCLKLAIMLIVLVGKLIQPGRDADDIIFAFEISTIRNKLWMCVAYCDICRKKFCKYLDNIVIYNKYCFLFVKLITVQFKMTKMTFLRKTYFYLSFENGWKYLI